MRYWQYFILACIGLGIVLFVVSIIAVLVLAASENFMAIPREQRDIYIGLSLGFIAICMFIALILRWMDKGTEKRKQRYEELVDQLQLAGLGLRAARDEATKITGYAPYEPYR